MPPNYTVRQCMIIVCAELTNHARPSEEIANTLAVKLSCEALKHRHSPPTLC